MKNPNPECPREDCKFITFGRGEPKMTNYSSYRCQKCGEQIGYIGRFFQFIRVPLHQCEETKKPYKVKIEISECGSSQWVNSGEYFLSEEGKEFLKEMNEFAKRNIKKK